MKVEIKGIVIVEAKIWYANQHLYRCHPDRVNEVSINS